jgi:hypothetical protein
MEKIHQTPADQLQFLLDIEAIKFLKARFLRAVDEQIAAPSPERLAAIESYLTPDAVLEVGVTRHLGISAILRLYSETIPLVRSHVWHSAHCPAIVIQGDTAHAEWTFHARALSKGDRQGPTFSYGRYVDDYLRTDDGWKLASMKVSFVPEP